MAVVSAAKITPRLISLWWAFFRIRRCARRQILPLTGLPSLDAKRAWLCLNLLLIGFSLAILRNVTELPWRRLLLLAFLCVYPLRTNFLWGQYYLVILALICVAYYAACRGRHFSSGTALALAAAFKIFPAAFLIQRASASETIAATTPPTPVSSAPEATAQSPERKP